MAYFISGGVSLPPPCIVSPPSPAPWHLDRLTLCSGKGRRASQQPLKLLAAQDNGLIDTFLVTVNRSYFSSTSLATDETVFLASARGTVLSLKALRDFAGKYSHMKGPVPDAFGGPPTQVPAMRKKMACFEETRSRCMYNPRPNSSFLSQVGLLTGCPP